MTSIISSGSFTNVASTPYFIPLEQHVSYFKLVNASKLASYTSARITNAEYWDYMANGIAYVDAPTTITGPLNTNAVIRTQLAQNGITIYNPLVGIKGPLVSMASFVPSASTTTNATVWTAAAHGFQVGDNVRFTNLATAPQIGGLVMTVTAVSTNTFTTLFCSANAVTSTGTVQKIGNVNLPNSSLYYPQNRAIANISVGSAMVVTTLVQQNYSEGDVVTFDIPTIYWNGNTPQLVNQYSGLPFQATVSAVNNAVGSQTITFANVNSSSFAQFQWAVAASFPYGLPIMVPQGEGNTNNFLNGVPAPSPYPYANQNVLSFARQNLASAGVLIGAGDGTAASSTGGLIGSTVDTWYWEAHSSSQQFPQV